MTIGIPGLTRPARTDMAVLHSFRAVHRTASPIGFAHWLAAIPPWVVLSAVALAMLWPSIGVAQAENAASGNGPFQTLLRWIPFLIIDGFSMTVLISVLTMAIATVLGAFLGMAQVSPRRWIRVPAYWITQIFRNSPWLVLLFIVMLSFPFEFTIGGMIIPMPGWIKAVIGLSLPVMANVSEIVRGAVASVPSAQWEAAESLAFSRPQTMFQIILPQCIKRMIPPWMNWYAILTMATPVVSILGVDEVLNLTRQAIEAEGGRPELLMPFYGFVLLLFFAYCYPIARLTVRLERRYAVKL